METKRTHFEEAARAAKVAKLVAACRRGDGSYYPSATVEGFTDEQWSLLEEIGMVVHTASAETRSQVVAELRAIEAPAEDDPFVGLV